ncbi:Leucine-rich repeat domain superfamily [Sesbania bispinosa]|nr:Leucine-rich repeat domain superfamily [Sesbania bispinosa]
MAMVDRISPLPDDILCHILSFLSTKDAISTSLLSKRWRPLWRSLPCLHFDLNFPNSPSIYINNCNIIYRIILSRDHIKSLRFQCGPIFNFYLDPLDANINEWVDIAIQHGLENLDLGHPCDPPIPTLWSSSIFRCKTLVVLKLEGFFVDVDDIVHLPSLKILILDCAYFREPRCVLKLLSGCPSLENLEANCIDYDGPIEEDSEEEQDESIEEDPEEEQDEPIEEDMEETNGDYDGISLPKLVNAEVSCLTPDIPLRAISSVRFLRMDEYLGDIPVFPNLTHLEIGMRIKINWPLVLEMLKQCPKLQVLVLNIAVVEFSSFADVDWPYPQFNSRALRTMTIYNAPSHAKLEMLKELEGSSAICQISFMD